MRVICLLLLLSACDGESTGAGRPVAPAPLASAPDPCRGTALDLDELVERCRLDTAPPPSALHVELVPADPVIGSGESIPLAVRMTNVTSKPLPVTLRSSYFLAKLDPGEARAADDCANDMIDGVKILPPVRVVLEPGGTLTKHVELKATFEAGGKADAMMFCDATARPLPPGRYPLEVTVPLDDAATPRVLRASVTIR